LLEQKILVEQSVLVGASIACFIEDVNVQVKDDFYETSKPLFAHFKKRVEETIGIVTNFVIEQSETKMAEIVLKKLDDIAKTGDYKKEKLLESFADILSECNREMRENVKYLRVEPISNEKVSDIFSEVADFYDELRRKIRDLDPSSEIMTKAWQAKSSAKNVGDEKFFEKIYADGVQPELEAFDKLKRKFIDKGPDWVDIEILAEAAYLAKIYLKTKTKLWLVSNDQHFVKVNVESKISEIVPKRIAEEFNVYCERPEELLKIIKHKPT